MVHRRPLPLILSVLALAAAPAGAQAAPLIAPLDVRVTADVLPGSVLQGTWNAEVTDDGGLWTGENIKLTETWTRGVPAPTRVRGKAQGGPERIHYVDVNYLMRRQGQGMLLEALPEGEPTPPRELVCRAQGVEGQGDTMVTAGTTAIQVVDQPARNRVVVRGPAISFLGPECQVPGVDHTRLVVGIHPPIAATPWVPRGTTAAKWEMTIPRAEFAAGGTFRFDGSYSYVSRHETWKPDAVWGTQLTHGKVALAVKVRRLSR